MAKRKTQQPSLEARVREIDATMATLDELAASLVDAAPQISELDTHFLDDIDEKHDTAQSRLRTLQRHVKRGARFYWTDDGDLILRDKKGQPVFEDANGYEDDESDVSGPLEAADDQLDIATNELATYAQRLDEFTTMRESIQKGSARIERLAKQLYTTLQKEIAKRKARHSRLHDGYEALPDPIL